MSSNDSITKRKPRQEGSPILDISNQPNTHVLWVDLETTGRNCELDGIVEIGAILEINRKVVDSFQCYVRPFESDRIQPEAMAIHGLSLEFLREKGLHPVDACQQFVDWLSKYININDDSYSYTQRAWIKGWRVHFDLMFLQLFFEKLERKDFFMYCRSLAWDVGARFLSLFEDHLHLVPQHFHLTDALQFVGIEKDPKLTAHNALDDIEMVRTLDERLRYMEPFKPKIRG